MAFAPALVEEATRFIQDVLPWPYVAVHMRRGDYLSRSEAVPSIPDTIDMLKARAVLRMQPESNELMSALMCAKDVRRQYRGRAVFVATDARPDDLEFRKLQHAKIRFFRFPSGESIDNVRDVTCRGTSMIGCVM